MPLPHFGKCDEQPDCQRTGQATAPPVAAPLGARPIRVGVARTGHWPGGGAALRLPRPAPSGGGTFPTSGPADRFAATAPRISGAADDGPTRPVSRSIASVRNPRGEPASAIPVGDGADVASRSPRGLRAVARSRARGSGPRSYP